MEQQQNKFACMCRKLCAYRLKGDYSMNMGLYDSNSSDSPSCSHGCRGKTDVCALKAAALVTATLAGMCIVKSICCMLKGK